MQSFHQDWTNMGNETDVVRQVLWPGQDPRAVSTILHDTDLAAGSLSDAHIEVLWLAGTDGRSPFNGSARGVKWMTSIAALCRDWLTRYTVGESPLNQGNSELIFQEDVLREIEDIGVQFERHRVPRSISDWTAVKAALAACAEMCSSDLALRGLVRVICCNGIGLSSAQYSQLVALGHRFEYGQLLVSRALPFVAP
jgi:hypothetical protein